MWFYELRVPCIVVWGKAGLEFRVDPYYNYMAVS